MIDAIYRLFQETLPDIVRNEDTVKGILSDKDNHIIAREDGGGLTGVSVVNGNTIYLFCVKKPLRNRGIGSALLRQSERHILSSGFHNAVVGVGKEYIMPGIPMKEGAHHFFRKRGYVHSWGDCRCFDMAQNLKDFHHTEHSIGDTIDGVTYRWAAARDLNGIARCVSEAEGSFLKYYQNKAPYEKDTKTPVLIAETAGEIVGALLVGIETEAENMGSVGCTATSPAHRNKGIATNMVKLGTKHLKDMGLCKAFLGYTYTDIVNMYGRAGYQVCMEYYMGEKTLDESPSRV